MTAIAPSVAPVPVADDGRAVDASARWALLLMAASALLWLVAGGTLALIHTIQLHTPTFFADCSWFTFGRTQAAAETALVYGWAANAGYAAGLWLLGRLGGHRARAVGLSFVATLFWNAGVTYALCGLLGGDLPGHPLVQLPGYTLVALLISASAMAVAGVLAWSDRQKKDTYATQWYACAALFVLPWLLSVALVCLHLSPANGVAEVVAATWTGQAVLALWLAPLALAVAYYLVPKITGREVPNYSMAKAGFWLLVIFGPWMGTRELIGGPFPAWIPAVGVAASLVMLVHYVIVAFNLAPVFSGAMIRSVPLRFAALSVAFYVVLGVAGLACTLFPLAPWVQFTYVDEARSTLMVLGVFTSAMFAATYFLVPRVTGRAWASDGLILQHFRFYAIGLVLVAVGLIGAGLQQSTLYFYKDVQFSQITPTLKPWLLLYSAGIGLQLIGAVFLLVNLGFQIKPGTEAAEAAKR